MNVNDISIVGAGPAGIAAAIYLKRAGFRPRVYERGELGGLLLNANLVENYPGFPGGIPGYNLVCLMREQLSILKIPVVRKNVNSISITDNVIDIFTEGSEEKSRSVIMATGTQPKPIEMKGSRPLIDRKIFYEIKDIPDPRREDTYVIIGGGDAAFDYALNLSKRAARVDVLFRSVSPRCLPLLGERVALRENIMVHPATSVLEVKEENEQMTFSCVSAEKTNSFKSDFALVACGRAPNLEVLPEEMRKTLLINHDGTTSIPGLFVAGDVRRGRFRQAGIAVGDGILCAMKAEEFLRGDGE